LLAGAELGQKFAKNCVIHWLDQMGVNTRLLGPSSVFVLTPSRQGHQKRAALPALLFTDATSRLVPVEDRTLPPCISVNVLTSDSQM
jgi:hypothetical protein